MQRHVDTPLGCFVRKQLHRLRLSQGAAAERLGISRQGLGKILSGQTTKPDISLLVKLSVVLEVPEGDVFRAALEGIRSTDGLIPTIYHINQTDKTAFVRDVTIPDMTSILTGSSFTKKWTLKNAGSEHWFKRRLRCMDSDYVMARRDSPGILVEQASISLKPTTREIVIPDTAPGAVVTLAVDFVAPTHPCTTLSTWKMVNEVGELCFPDLAGLWCLVKVYDL